MAILGDSWKFQILPFDSRAAIEAAELIESVKSRKQRWDTWAKVKFDIQIVAIAKAEAATVIYSDDKDIENFAKRFKIRVIRICDLPLPPGKNATSIISGAVGSQRDLWGTGIEPTTGEELQSEPEADSSGTMAETGSPNLPQMKGE